MWTCPNCKREFPIANWRHICNDITIDDLFASKPNCLLLAFDELLMAVMQWEPNTVGAATKAVVFTNKYAWLVVRPMSKELDVKFYYPEPLQSPFLHKIGKPYGSKYPHHIRLRDEGDLKPEMVDLLRKGFDFGLR